jgi:hypothetical protein
MDCPNNLRPFTFIESFNSIHMCMPLMPLLKCMCPPCTVQRRQRLFFTLNQPYKRVNFYKNLCLESYVVLFHRCSHLEQGRAPPAPKIVCSQSRLSRWGSFLAWLVSTRNESALLPFLRFAAKAAYLRAFFSFLPLLCCSVCSVSRATRCTEVQCFV